MCNCQIWSRFIAWVGGFSIPFYKSTGNSPFDFKIFFFYFVSGMRAIDKCLIKIGRQQHPDGSFNRVRANRNKLFLYANPNIILHFFLLFFLF